MNEKEFFSARSVQNVQTAAFHPNECQKGDEKTRVEGIEFLNFCFSKMFLNKIRKSFKIENVFYSDMSTIYVSNPSMVV